MDPTAGSAAVVLLGVTRDFEGGVRALDQVDAQFRLGESCAVTGASGSGKSTLLNVVGLLDRPTSGAYELFGKDVAGSSDAERSRHRLATFGFVFQSFHLLGHRSVLENVMLGGFYSGASRRVLARTAGALVERVGLGGRSGFPISKLSGGERQRVAIARALMNGPRVLLCDEPTGNLDSASAKQVLDLLFSLVGDELALVVVTHDPGVAGRCSRRLAMSDGRLADG
jgi:putative ABC transport system ATP-binding protein